MLGSVGERAFTMVMDFQHEGSWHRRCSCGGIGVTGRCGLCVLTTSAPFGARRNRHGDLRVVGHNKDHGRLEAGGAAWAILAASDPRVTSGRR